MDLDWNLLEQAESALSTLLRPFLADIANKVASGDTLVEIPTAQTASLPIEELAALVARTSNTYGHLARLAGMARAEAKLSRGRFERKFKRSRRGSNEAERQANAMDAAASEHAAATLAESLAEAAEALEDAARVASESARRLLGAAERNMVGHSREDRASGYYTEKTEKSPNPSFDW